MKIVVTGAGGLVGSSVTRWLDRHGHAVVGIENNTRATLFGPGGDVSGSLEELHRVCSRRLRIEKWDLRDRARVHGLFRAERFDAVVHCAAQPSHDWAGKSPDDDFALNVVVTQSLLQANQLFSAQSPFVFMSTNKVYGEFPNSLRMHESDLRYDVVDERFPSGISEAAAVDQVGKTLFGAHKAAADLLVQEYGHYYGMPTACLRGGCLTGAAHAGVELHGFLSYLIRCAVTGTPYTVFGHKGKQVRDNLCADDLADLISRIIEQPGRAAVYNVGGGAQNSLSMLEAIEYLQQWLGLELAWTYQDQPRHGDHISYVSDLNRVQSAYPGWKPTTDLHSMFVQIATGHGWS